MRASAAVSAILVLCSSAPVVSQRLQEHPLRAAERILGTASQLDWGFHRVVEDPSGLGLKFPGFLIGVEKARRAHLGVVDTGAAAPQSIAYAPSGSDAEERAVLRRILNDRERTFVSHVVSYEHVTLPLSHIRQTFVHNAYARSAAAAAYHGWSSHGLPGEYPFYEPHLTPYADSWNALDKLGRALRERLQNARASGAPVSHVFVASMGWNTTQAEAIRNYNSIFGNLFEHARGRGAGTLVAPVVIGFSWPSRWNVPVVSYPNKADDADEVGVLWANYLINRVLLPLKREFGFRVVVIGHSFGARLVTRAVFSPAVLGIQPTPEKVDLVVSLEGAFSANRFIPERREGLEGAPYARYRELASQVVLTWSKFDRANPLADLITSANNVGGAPGHERARQYRNHFNPITWNAGAWLPPMSERDGRILMVDASGIIRYNTYEKRGGAHSDIYHPGLGQFLFDVVQAFAP